MIRVTAESLLEYAETLKYKPLFTLHQHKEFCVVEVEPGRIRFKPAERTAEGNGPREPRLEVVESICERFCETHSLRPSDYQVTGTWNAPYVLTLIVKYLAAIADGSTQS